MAREKFKLKIKQSFKAPIKSVFEAWTNPEQVAKWYGPEGFTNKVHEFDFKVGGRYRITMTGPKGERHTVVGEFKSIESPRLVAYTWRWEGSPVEPTLVTVELEAKEGATEMHFKHSGFAETADRDNHDKGWLSSFAKLERYLV